MKMIRLISVIVLLIAIFNIGVSDAQKSADKTNQITLKQALKDNQFPLQLEDGHLKGKGGAWLREQAAKATIVTIGESHATQEIPAMIASLIKDLQQKDEFDHLVLEVSPWTAEQMTDRLAAGKEVYDKFIDKYPAAVPFYNFKEERNLVYQVVQDSNGEKPLWGMDQIFAFSTSLALDRLHELAPSSRAQQAVKKTREAGKRSSTNDPRLQELPSGIPTPIAVYKPAAFDTLRSYFSGIEEAQQILSELAKSVEIYRTNDDNNYASNQIRARYLRDNLREFVNKVREQSDETPQIVIKTGARHAYRGITPNNALDVGNLSVALARAMGGEALNIAIICGPGSKITAFPNRVVENRSSYLGEEFLSLAKDQAMLFDLTGIHPLLHEGTIDPKEELEDFFWGFDAVVLVPNATPAEYISFPVER